MKPFDLEKALAGDPVVTRDGRRIIKMYPIFHMPPYNIRAYLDSGDSFPVTEDGVYVEGGEDGCDLFMVESIKKIYVHIYKCADGIYGAYASNISGMEMSEFPPVKTLEVEIYE